MRDFGGFEGNAQTLRILAKIEKRQTLNQEVSPVKEGTDARLGLNLTYRTLASVLKYDNCIPRLGKDRGTNGVTKGYYYTEANLVQKIKKAIGLKSNQKIKTIECTIMDVADDIAYSTYDLEDAFKGGFLDPLKMIACPTEVADRVAEVVQVQLKSEFGERQFFETQDVYSVLLGIFSNLFAESIDVFERVEEGALEKTAAAVDIASVAMQASQTLGLVGYHRTKLTSELVRNFIRGTEVELDEACPALSRVYLSLETRKMVEVLKNFANQSLILSPMLKVAEYRGKQIIEKIFRALDSETGHLLMPQDYRNLYAELADPAEKKRSIADFIAGMSDRYAIHFYNRLFGTMPESIYSPL